MTFKKLLIGFTGGLIGCVSYAAPTPVITPVVVPAPQIQSLSVATTVVNSGAGRPQIGIALAAPAAVQIMQGATVLLTTNLPAGVSYVDTTNFPVGTYPVNIQVTENNMSFKVSQNISITQ